MAILFPTGLDNFTNPTAGDNLNTPAVLHSDQHVNENDAIEALEAKVGIDGSLVTGTFDYRIRYLENNQHTPVTLGTANGLSLSGQQLSMELAGANSTGTLSAQDWNTFNSKQSALTFPLAASLGGTSVNNSGTFTNHNNLIVTGGGTLALGGFTLTVPATLTVAGLAIANVFTAAQTITPSANGTSILTVKNQAATISVLNVDTTNARVGVRTATPAQSLDIVGNLRFSTITPPGVVTLALAGLGAGNVDNGVHRYAVSFVTSDGTETDVSTWAAITVADKTVNGQVSVSGIPTSSSALVTSRKLYRTKAGSLSLYYLLTTLADNTTTAYTDNTADTSLTGTGFQIPNDNLTAGSIYINTSRSLFTGTTSTGVGINALASLTVGISNTAYGVESLYSLTSGGENAAGGGYSLRSQTTSSRNTAFGYSAGYYLQTGTDNVFLGHSAGYGISRTSSDLNTVVGAFAGASMATNQDGNVFLGYKAGNLSTGGYNIYLGTHAGAKQTSGASLFIVDAQTAARADTTAEAENSFLYGSTAAGGYLQLNIPTTTTNAVKDTLKLQAYVSTASTGSANGFGVGLPFFAETATDLTYQQQGLISTSWIDATNATRKAKMSLSAYDTAARLGIEIEASGTAPMLGFYGVAPVIRATNAGAAGAFVANTSGIANDTATFGGYTLGQIVQALINIGILT